MDGFESGVVRLTRSLHRFALVLTRNTDDAEDLVQDTVLRAIDKRDYFAVGTDLGAWCRAILYRIFITGARRRRRARCVIVDGLDLQGLPVSDATVDPSLDLVVRDVERSLSRLSAEKRAAVLEMVDGASYHEASQRLGVPIGTMRSRLSRGRAELRGMIGGNQGT